MGHKRHSEHPQRIRSRTLLPDTSSNGHDHRDDGRMKLAKNVVVDDRGMVLRVENLATATEYVDKFFLSPSKSDGKKSAKKYVTLTGFSNPEYPSGLINQGLAKTALAAIAVLSDRAVQQDAEAQAVLGVLEQFLTHQPKKASKESQRRLKRVLEQIKELASRLPSTDGEAGELLAILYKFIAHQGERSRKAAIKSLQRMSHTAQLASV